MKLHNDFVVPVSADKAWAVLLDVERIAPCLPGATLTGFTDDTFDGLVKVKIGPITMSYTGSARFVSRDDDAYVMVIEASGTEQRGAGLAKAMVTASLHEGEGGTRVDVQTELILTGRPAQFGGPVIAEISSRLINQFAGNLRTLILSDEADSSAQVQPSAAGLSPSRPSSVSSAPTSITPADSTLDLFSMIGMPPLKKVLLGLAGVGALLVLLRSVRRPSPGIVLTLQDGDAIVIRRSQT
jgi:carbon monoxide dehydrogenase subunit G